MPVSVLNSNDTSAVADVATMAMAHDQVVAANSHTVSGLERPVVVWVQGDAVPADESVGRAVCGSSDHRNQLKHLTADLDC